MTAKKIEIIIPAGGAKPAAPYSPGIHYGDLVFASGQVGIDPATGKLAEGGVQAEARQCLENLKMVLEAAGSDMDHALKCTVFMVDIADFQTINEIYATYFTGNPPARSAFQVGALPFGALVEIEAIAAVKGE
jgi:2-iminobutanoate/2-iminopropanoate deaminase